MYNPFEEKVEAQDDVGLIRQALEGNRKGLEKLIFRHQAWIYNIALKMVSDPVEAEDITQEILIKMMTKLSTYNSRKASFRTWLYRIAANHVINMNKRKYEYAISSVQDLQDLSASFDEIPDGKPSSYPEHDILVKESKNCCLNGVLLCLDRRQRLVFILGAVFGVSGSMGSEILEISQSNFRKILSRSRNKIFNFLNQNCGLINKACSCHCSKRIDLQIQIGLINPDNLLSNQGSQGKISEILHEKVRSLESSYYDEYIRLFREQPFFEPPDQTEWLRETLENDDFKNLLHLH